MKRIFKTCTFARWMQKSALSDDALYRAVLEMAQGLVDADLGGCVVKKRIALPGRGKVVVLEPLLRPIEETDGFSCMASRKMNAQTLTRTS